MTFEEYRAAAPSVVVDLDVTFDVHDATSNAPVVKKLLDDLDATATTQWGVNVLYDRNGETILSFQYYSGNPVPSPNDIIEEMS